MNKSWSLFKKVKTGSKRALYLCGIKIFTYKKQEKKTPYYIHPYTQGESAKVHCPICSNTSYKVFNARIMQTENAEYFWCEHCGFLHINNPTWLEKAYEHAVVDFDTGILVRNESMRNALSVVLYSLFKDQGHFLDFAGGYGFLTRMMRDVGFDFYWNDKYCQNITAIGFEGDLSQEYDAVISIESFEHFPDPIDEIEKMLRLSRTIIFSTVTLPPSFPKPEEWWYYALDSGQHISFYTEKTFNFIANKYGLKYSSFKGLHIFTDQKINKDVLQSLTVNDVKKKMKSKTFSDMLFLMKKE